MIKTILRVVASGAVLTAGAAHAAIDTSTITSTVTDVGAAIAVVGAAVVAIHYGKRVWSWIRM